MAALEKYGMLKIGSEATFGAGATTSYFRARKVVMPTGRELEPGQNLAQSEGLDEPILLHKPGDGSMEMDAYGAVSAWPTAELASPAYTPTNMIMASAVCGAASGGYGVVNAGSTLTTVSFATDPVTLGFAIGQLVFLRTAGNGNVYAMNRIKAIDSVYNDITLQTKLPAIPVATDICYGSEYNYLVDGAVPNYEVDFLGGNKFDKTICKGCATNKLTLDVMFGKSAVFNLGFRSALPGYYAAAESGGAITPQSWSYTAVQGIEGGLYLYDSAGSGTLHKLEGDLKLDLGISLAENGGINAVDPNGVASYVFANRAPTVTLNPLYVNNALYALAETVPSGCSLVAWWGRGYNAMGFCIPNVIWKKIPDRQARDGVIDLSIELGCGQYNGDTGAGTSADAIDKPFVFGVLS